jgi:hypothetical protein
MLAGQQPLAPSSSAVLVANQGSHESQQGTDNEQSPHHIKNCWVGKGGPIQATFSHLVMTISTIQQQA